MVPGQYEPVSGGDTQPVLAWGGGELELDEGRGVGGTARQEADREVLLGWNDVDLGLCLECQELLYTDNDII